ncbi:hypothetical protein ACW9HJ_32630 [Nocardia gipuzkoensis]
MNGVSGLLNVVDVEAMCWAGKVPAGAVSEIIEIGLTVVDWDAGERIAKAYGLNRRQGMAGALDIAGLPLEGRHHCGADDAWNIAGLVLNIRERNAWRVTSEA